MACKSLIFNLYFRDHEPNVFHMDDQCYPTSEELKIHLKHYLYVLKSFKNKIQYLVTSGEHHPQIQTA